MLGRMKLAQVGDHCYAVLSEANRLCDANSGLVNLGGGLVIDTQCDLGHARRMIELFGTVWPAMPKRVALTHEDADHVWGNQLFADAQIIAQHKIRERMPHTADPRELQRLQATARSILRRIVLRLSNPGVLKLAQQLAEDYDFDDIELTLPNVSFDERYELNLDGVDVHLIHVGPSHQWGDTIIHIPAERVVFSGDVVFRQCTPMGWSGTYERWIKNLEFIESLAPEVIMPGHGPLCGLEGPREMKAYLQYMYTESRRSFDEGLSEAEAARRIDFGPYDAWRAPARLYFNVARAYREFRGEPHDAPWNIPKMFAGMYRVAKAQRIGNRVLKRASIAGKRRAPAGTLKDCHASQRIHPGEPRHGPPHSKKLDGQFFRRRSNWHQLPLARRAVLRDPHRAGWWAAESTIFARPTSSIWPWPSPAARRPNRCASPKICTKPRSSKSATPPKSWA